MTSKTLPSDADLDQLSIDTIRTLAMDAVEKAKSGHPGTPMAMAPVGYTLWQQVLRYDPADPDWPNRDRFVLSVGHASMLLYALLHLAEVRCGSKSDQGDRRFAVTLGDIEQFRQLSSVTPGHPEYRLTCGVETTTGPLAQGVANSVGMAMAQRFLAARYNQPGFELFDYRVYALCGDGCMMEGVSNEAASIAGHLCLDNLTWIYDSNHISIEGETCLTFSDDVGARLQAMGWHVLHVDDPNDTRQVRRSLDEANAHTDGPTLIVVHSVIGYGAPTKAGTRAAHGEPLGTEEVAGAKRSYGWPENARFLVPDGVKKHFAENMGRRGAQLRSTWTELLARYRDRYPKLAHELDLIYRQELPEGWDAGIPEFAADEAGIASRDASQRVLNAIAPRVPWMIGGAADLAPSTKSNLTFDGVGSYEAGNYGGRNLHFGVREHAMGSITNGLALSGLRAYASGFLIFSDYMKAPIRLAAIMQLPVIYIFTHDSIGVGEDGPTHQPVEQLACLRAIPGMTVVRPADANEVSEAWRFAMNHKSGPVSLVLSRQKLPTFDRSTLAAASGLSRGAYVLSGPTDRDPDVILVATGSEVALCLRVARQIERDGHQARVVSMPSWELFEQQPRSYRDDVLPRHVTARVVVEQAASIGWDRYAGADGAIVAMHTFGASAPIADLQSKFGFTPEKVLAAARDQIALHALRNAGPQEARG